MSGVTFIYAIPSLPPPQDRDELLAWAFGEDIHMRPLTDEDKDRIREIERIRVAAQRDIYSDPSTQQGPVVGNCPSCGRQLRAHWRYCPFCGALGAGVPAVPRTAPPRGWSQLLPRLRSPLRSISADWITIWEDPALFVVEETGGVPGGAPARRWSYVHCPSYFSFRWVVAPW